MTVPEGDSSLLSFAELALPPYSFRGITESFELIEQASQFRRDVNGNLHNVGADEFRLFRVTVQCRDQQSPGLDGVWPGRQLTMNCASEFSTEGATDSDGFERQAVPDSIRTEGDFIFYRPQLFVVVLSYRMEFEEWEAGIAWELVVEERAPPA